PLRPERIDGAGVIDECGASAGDRFGAQASGAVHVLPQPDDLHPTGQVDQSYTAVWSGAYVGYQQSDRVGPAVDRRHPGHPATLTVWRGTPAVAGLQMKQHASVAQGVGFDPLQVEELGHPFVVGAQQLLVDGRRHRRTVDLDEAEPPEERRLE